MKRLLVTGGSGFLGGQLVKAALRQWEVLYTWHHHEVALPGARGARLDILDRQGVDTLFRDFRPDAVIHTAYSQQDLIVITKGTENIARACDRARARLVHMSTDAVFDGEGGWYREQDLPRPIHPYGKAKLESEHIVAASETAANSLAVILRLSLVWGLDPIDPRTLYIRECLARKTPLVLYDDEYRCPARVDQLATAILELCGLEFSGVLHLAGPERLNRYQFGLLLARNQGWAESGISKGPSTLSGTVRPRDCSLDSSLARRLLKTKLSAPSDLL